MSAHNKEREYERDCMRDQMKRRALCGTATAFMATSLITLALSAGSPAMAEDIQVVSGNELAAEAGAESAPAAPATDAAKTDADADNVEPVYYIDAKGERQEVPASECIDISTPPFDEGDGAALQTGWYVMGEGRDFDEAIDWRAKRTEHGIKTYLNVSGDVSLVAAPERLNALGCTIKVDKGASLHLYALATSEGAVRGIDDDSVQHNPVVIENYGAVEINGTEDTVYHLGVTGMAHSSFAMRSGSIDGTADADGHAVVVHADASTEAKGGSISSMSVEAGAYALVSGGHITRIDADAKIHVKGAPVVECIKGSDTCTPLIECDDSFEKGASIGVDTKARGPITHNYGGFYGFLDEDIDEKFAADPYIHAVGGETLVLDEKKELRYDEYLLVGENGTPCRVAKDVPTDISDPSFKDCSGYSLGDGWYVVKSDREFKNRLAITGDVKLILCDGVTANFKKGIRGKSGKLTIYAESDGDKMGKLIATGAGDDDCEHAGIGGNNEEPNRTEIVICGGRIEAKGGYYAAAIGGGDHGGCGLIRIYGGDITAEGGLGHFIVQGGGAGIGSGDAAKQGGTVEIAGGVIHAWGTDYGAGIGTGDEAKADVSVKISGGDVTADGADHAAGIGGGNESSCDVEITGGKVNATGGEWGAGIGTGDESDGGGTIKISGGDVTATGGKKGAGIGGGNETGGGTIEISGGTVRAGAPKGGGIASWFTGDSGGAGIGGGDEGNSGNITITGGDVRAEANGDGARAIGHGDEGKNKTIILGDNIKVVGNKGKTLTGKDRDDAIKKWHWLNTKLV